jgi:hypothetical protein
VSGIVTGRTQYRRARRSFSRHVRSAKAFPSIRRIAKFSHNLVVARSSLRPK